jgi:uncharacterized protein (TIRG00374 family)
MSRLTRILPGLILSILAILALVFIVDWRATAESWGHANLWVLLPAFACVVFGMLARAAGWRFLMGNPVPLRACFWNLNISYLLNGILPFRLGDIARAYLIARPAGGPAPKAGETGKVAPPQAGVSTAAALSAVVLERVFDLIFTFILVLTVFPMIAGGEWGNRVTLYTAALALVGFSGLLLVGAAGDRISRLAEAAANRFPILRPLVSPLEHFLEGLRKMRNLRRSVPGFLLIGLGMTFWAAEYWIVLVGFFPGAPLYWGLLSLIGGLIGVMLPSSPSSLGVFEAAVVFVLTLSGLAQGAAAAFAIAIHMFNIITLSAMGALGLLVERQSLGSILAAVQRPAPRAEDPAA